jgi:hypothetical protein
MFGRRRGTWIQFDSKDPKTKIVTLGSSCISTSSESAGHLQSVIGSGRIAGVNDRVKDAPQIPQVGRVLAQV